MTRLVPLHLDMREVKTKVIAINGTIICIRVNQINDCTAILHNKSGLHFKEAAILGSGLMQTNISPSVG